MRKLVGLALGLALALVPSASWAQTATGNIYGTVTDESGAVLPGATASLTGANIGSRSTATGSQGDFRFLSLSPGTYTLNVALTGFTTVKRDLRIVTGTNVNLTFNLKVATVEETVTVTAETPVVDTKKTGTSLTMTREELEKTPQARDPWAVLRTIPGVLVDRVNVAGNESGQQAGFTGKGSSDDDTQWNLDGVVITDMAAIGASPTYYDWDAFDEISVSTGGNDIKAATGGISLNFVTKRGTNAFHGSGRYFMTHDDMQSSNLPDELLNDARLANADGTRRDKADHIQQIGDYGFDLGGPIIKDKFWFYGSYGVQDIRLTRLNGTPDKTKLESYNGKLNFQATPNDMLSFFYFRGLKIKEGRGIGYPGEQDSFLWNQGDEVPDDLGGFPGLGKVEWNHVFGPDFVVNAKYAYYGTGFHLFSRGDISEPGVIDVANSTAEGSSLNYSTKRPQHTVNVDANYFFTGMGGNHELKFGFGYRKTPVTSETVYGGRLWGYDYGGGGYAYVYRDAVTQYEGKYVSGYVGDTFTKDRLTLNVGVRYDSQNARNVASSIPGNPDFPNLLPGIDYDGRGTEIDWSDISPRVGLTYALDESRKTVLRGSFARYAGQLSIGDVATYQNPVGISWILYNWVDTNLDGKITTNEIFGDDGGAPSRSNFLVSSNYDPNNPSAAASVRAIDPDYNANHDNEFIVGLDRELRDNLAVGLAYTYRKGTDLSWPGNSSQSLIICQGERPCTSADYIPAPPRTFQGQTYQAYGVNPASARSPRGSMLANRPGHSRTFSGVEASLIKRLSNKWMGRVAFSLNDWKDNIEPEAISDPTTRRNSPLLDGGQVVLISGGSGKSQLYSSVKWQLSANALVELPWSFELSGALFGRQGHPQTVFAQFSIPGEPSKEILAVGGNKIDSQRYPNLWNLDLRLAKNLRFGDANVVLSAEAFNALNANPELTRVNNAASSAFNRLDEVLSPRIVRFGVRFVF